jgi:small subunit ribosomal protein S1
VFVERLDEAEGRVRLSRDRATKLKTWRAIEDAYKSESPVKGQVLDRVKGGLSVDIGVRAFLPGSLVDLLPNRRLEDYLGQEIEARIISFDRRRSNVVLSRKAILEEAQGKVKEKTMETLEEGGLVNGVIKNLTDYGSRSVTRSTSLCCVLIASASGFPSVTSNDSKIRGFSCRRNTRSESVSRARS